MHFSQNNKASMKNRENHIGRIAKQIANQSNGIFSGNTQDNPRNESCKDIELRSKKVLTSVVPKVIKRREVENVGEDELVVENKNGEVENRNGGVENEKEEKNSEREKNEKKERLGRKKKKLIVVDTILRRIKNQILEGRDKKHEVSSYVKLPYPHLSKKKEKQEGQFKKFMELFTQLQVNIPFSKALDQMLVYANL